MHYGRSVSGNSIQDHLNYYGVYLRTEDNVLALVNGTGQILGHCKTDVSS